MAAMTNGTITREIKHTNPLAVHNCDNFEPESEQQDEWGEWSGAVNVWERAGLSWLAQCSIAA